jgi:hypothetical protein
LTPSNDLPITNHQLPVTTYQSPFTLARRLPAGMLVRRLPAVGPAGRRIWRVLLAGLTIHEPPTTNHKPPTTNHELNYAKQTQFAGRPNEPKSCQNNELRTNNYEQRTKKQTQPVVSLPNLPVVSLPNLPVVSLSNLFIPAKSKRSGDP